MEYYLSSRHRMDLHDLPVISWRNMFSVLLIGFIFLPHSRLTADAANPTQPPSGKLIYILLFNLLSPRTSGMANLHSFLLQVYLTPNKGSGCSAFL